MVFLIFFTCYYWKKRKKSEFKYNIFHMDQEETNLIHCSSVKTESGRKEKQIQVLLFFFQNVVHWIVDKLELNLFLGDQCGLMVARIGTVIEALVFVIAIVPHETVFVELDHDHGTLVIGYAGRHQIGLIRILPFHEKHEFAFGVRCAQYLLGYQATFEALRLAIFVLNVKFSVQCLNQIQLVRQKTGIYIPVLRQQCAFSCMRLPLRPCVSRPPDISTRSHRWAPGSRDSPRVPMYCLPCKTNLGLVTDWMDVVKMCVLLGKAFPFEQILDLLAPYTLVDYAFNKIFNCVHFLLLFVMVFRQSSPVDDQISLKKINQLFGKISFSPYLYHTYINFRKKRRKNCFYFILTFVVVFRFKRISLSLSLHTHVYSIVYKLCMHVYIRACMLNVYEWNVFERYELKQPIQYVDDQSPPHAWGWQVPI